MIAQDKVFISFISTMGRVLLTESGEGTVMIEGQLHQVANAYGYHLNVLCLSDYLEITTSRDEEQIDHAIIHAMPGIASLSRISSVKTLVHQVDSGLTIEEANEKYCYGTSNLSFLVARYRRLPFRYGICTTCVCNLD